MVTKIISKVKLMKNTVSGCSIEDAMRLLGGRWRTLLIYYLIDGPRRFSDLRRDNPAISHRMLALDLRELEAAGVVSRTVHATVPPQVEYDLTSEGRKLVPLINALGDWWEQLAKSRQATGPEGCSLRERLYERVTRPVSSAPQLVKHMQPARPARRRDDRPPSQPATGAVSGTTARAASAHNPPAAEWSDRLSAK